MEELGQVNTYPDIFEDGDFFSPFRNKVGKGGGGVRHGAYLNRFRPFM